MSFSRRNFLKGLGAAGVAPGLINGCGSGGFKLPTGIPPIPDNLPEYAFDGALGPEALFSHGVASGDPLTDAIVLWTRVTPEESGPIEVWVEMSLDPSFQYRVFQDTVITDADRDYTVKIDVTGLVWKRNYYYRFFALGRQSSVGRTRLAPIGAEVDRLRIGVASCSSLAHGYFHAYQHLAARTDLDVVLHLGDYIYEYANGGYGSARQYEPPTEIVSLADYRMRYAQYRRESELQELHRQVPFIAIWDDHESADNSWMDGALNHQPETEGEWSDRKMASAQAYFEWMPIRDNPTRQIYRTLGYGDLVDFIMLDTRIVGREEAGPILVDPDDETLSEHLLGPEQETWVQGELLGSTAKWKLLGQQVVMSLWDAGSFHANGDQWNGYPAARNRFLNFLRDNALNNVVVLTGDVHSSWAMDVTPDDDTYNPETREGAVAVEFVTPGISSPGDGTLGTVVEAQLLPNSPHIRYWNIVNNGYMVLDVTADKVQADWYHLDGIAQDQGDESFATAWAVFDGQTHVEEMSGPEPSADEQVPPAPA